MRILIVGGGIGGLTLAGFLKDSDIDYKIIEKKTDWNHEGYSIGLWNNARNILAKLGLAEEFDKYGVHVKSMKICDGNGKILRTYSLKKFYENYGMGHVSIRRLDLHNWLFSRVDASKVVMSSRVVSIKNLEDKKVEVVFSNGSTEVFDAVVGADGVHSEIRSMYFKTDTEKYVNWRTFWMWADNKYKTESAVVGYVTPGENCVVFDDGDRSLILLFTKTDHKIWDDTEHRIERLKKLYQDRIKFVPEVLNSMKPEDIMPTDLEEVNLKSFHRDRVVLIGDAAHGVEPFSGLGGSMALEDAYVLAGELLKLKDGSIETAFANYEEKRRPRVKKVIRLAHRMQAWALIESKIIRKLMNMIIPLMPESLFVKSYFSILKEEI